jgi:hypothetical protein
MSQLQKFKAAKPHPEYKTRRALREFQANVREVAAFHNDCDAVEYALFYERIQEKNVRACAFAARASPAVH